MFALRVVFLLLTAGTLASQTSSPEAAAKSPFESIPSPSAAVLRFGGQIPEFEARDISGRTWRSKDLLGRITLIYIWSISSARMLDRIPLRLRIPLNLMDLSELQGFYEETKNKRDLQVLTFCRDFESGEPWYASDYLRQNRYSFPVITDYVTRAHLELAIDSLFPGEGTDGPWLVNPRGQLAHRVRSWSLGRLILEAERAASGH